MPAAGGTTLLVSSIGGHLSQLVEITARIRDRGSPFHWITFDCQQSRSLLEGSARTFIPRIRERDVPGVLRGFSHAHELFRTLDVTAVVSTGSGIALSFLPYAALRGIEAHYIESASRVEGPSLTGRLLQRVPGVNLYCQYPDNAKGRWRFVGCVFDAFATVPREAAAIRRLVVTVGSGHQSFIRLIAKLVAIIPPGVEVLWQTGSTPVDGLGIDARPFLPAAELEEAIRRADAVVGHAGVGTAMTAMNAGKLPVLVPRELRYGELIDDHQTRLGRWLDGRKLALLRTPETITWDDVAEASRCDVKRRDDPPSFPIVTSQSARRRLRAVAP